MVNRAELLSVTKSILHNMDISRLSGPGNTRRHHNPAYVIIIYIKSLQDYLVEAMLGRKNSVQGPPLLKLL